MLVLLPCSVDNNAIIASDKSTAFWLSGMTLLFLVFSLLIGWSALNLWFPARRRATPSLISFFCGWLGGELALHHIAWQVLVVFGFVWAGTVQGFPGAVGFAICTASWLASGYFYFTGEHAARAVESALTDALGTSYRDAIDPETVSRFAAHPSDRKLLMPFGKLDERVELLANLPFGSHDQRLDVYRSRRGLHDSPVLLQIHGGAWTEKMGSKEHQAIPLMTHMALRNWLCVSINYRLSPTATFPEHLIDCKEGVRWIRESIGEFGGDPNFIVVTGGSAGGHLCALMALTPGDPAYQPGFEDVDTRVQGAVPFYGVYDFTDPHWASSHRGRRDIIESSVMKLSRSAHGEEYRRASPVYRVHADAPPFLVVHGNRDSLVPVSQARDFVSQLRDVSSNPVAYAEIEGAQHAFDMFASLRSEYTKFGVERFLAWLHARYLSGNS